MLMRGILDVPTKMIYSHNPQCISNMPKSVASFVWDMGCIENP